MDVKKTIAELTSQLSEVNYDSEEENFLLKDSLNHSVDESEINNIDFELDRSTLRKATESFIYPESTYGGKKTTRKRTYSPSETSNCCINLKSIESDQSSDHNSDNSIESENDIETEDSVISDTEAHQEDSVKYSKLSRKDNSTLECNIYSVGSKNTPKDFKTGTAIKNQIRIWESLLECRIKLQKGLTASNNFSTSEVLKVKRTLSTEDQLKLNKCKKNVMDILGKMLSLQDDILKQCSDSKQQKEWSLCETNEEITSDESENEEEQEIEDQPLKKRMKLNDISNKLKLNHNTFVPLRNAAIQKWNDKTKVSTGKMAQSNFSAFDQSTLKQIELTLADKNRLINRTRFKRSENMKAKTNAELDQDCQELTLNEEIFDDSDFYHKLLRDYIERKTVDVTSSSHTERQMVELQKLRSKMKKNVDTKSTKGRKLRYIVIPKLVNFMAPQNYTSWNEQAESELYNSLFGKIKVSF